MTEQSPVNLRVGKVVFKPDSCTYAIQRVTQDNPFDANLYQFLAMVLQLERGEFIVSDVIAPWEVEFSAEGDSIAIGILVGTEVLPAQIALWVFSAKLVVEMEIQRQAVVRMQQEIIMDARQRGEGAVFDPRQVGMGGVPGRVIQPGGAALIDPKLAQAAAAQERNMKTTVRQYS